MPVKNNADIRDSTIPIPMEIPFENLKLKKKCKIYKKILQRNQL